MPELEIEECYLDLGQDGMIDAIVIRYPRPEELPDGTLTMTTMAIVGEKLVVGLHGRNCETETMSKPIGDLTEDVCTLVKLMWINELPN